MFGFIDPDDFRERIFRLCYHQNGGSGLSLSYDGLMSMPLSEFDWFIERLEEEREREVRASKGK